MFQCPLTLEKYVEPVCLPCDHTFEKASLTSWLVLQPGQCPFRCPNRTIDVRQLRVSSVVQKAMADTPSKLFCLGVCFDFGMGNVDKDARRACELYRQVAALWLVSDKQTKTYYRKSCYNLACNLIDEKKNLREASMWMHKAAAASHPKALMWIAEWYFAGSHGKSRRPRKPWRMLLLAARTKHAEAQFEVGKCLFRGVGATVDREEDRKWLQMCVRKIAPGGAVSRPERFRC